LNTFLITAGAVIITALLAAFVAPVFIDWNGYRDRIEAQAQLMLCREVEIAGDLEVRLLPEPVLTTGHIEVAGQDNQVLVSAAGTRLRLGLGDLLLGKIEVSALELDRPVFSVSTDANGELNWAQATARGCEPGLAGVNIRRIGIVNGIATFKAASSSEPVTIEQIDASLTSGGPAGPYKFTGTHGSAKDRLGFSISSGRISASAPTRVSGRIALDDRSEISFDGVAEGWQSPPLFSGVVKAEKTLPAPDGEMLLLHAEARAEVGLESWEFADLLLTATQNGTTSTASGSARIKFDEIAPDILVDLKARRVDFDKLLGNANAENGKAKAENDGFAAFAARTGAWAENSGLTGRVSISVDGAVFGGELMRDVSASFNLGAQNLGIEALRAILPGQSQLDFSGNYLQGSAGGKLLGTAVLSTTDLSALLEWAVPPAHLRFLNMLPPTRGSISLTGGLRAEAGALEITGIEGLMDAKPFSGDLSIDLRQPGEIYAALAFDELELDRILPEDFDPLARLVGGVVVDPALPTIGLEIEARRVRWRGREGRGLVMAGGFTAGRLVVERFNLENFAGGRLRAEGEALLTEDGPQGSLDINFETDNFPALPGLFGVDLAVETGLGVGWLSNIRKSSFSSRLSSAKDGEAWKIGLTLDGSLGETGISASVTSTGAPADAAKGRIDGTLSLANADAGRLFAQLGLGGLLASTPQSPGELTLNGVGTMANGFGYSARFNAFDASVAAEGNIETKPARVRGQLTMKAEDSNRIADLLGVGTLAPVLPKTDLEMNFDLKDGALDVSMFKGEIAGVQASGGGSWQISGRRSGTVDIKLARLSLPWALSSLFGGGSEASATFSPNSRALWSTELINSGILDRWPLSLKIGVGKLVLAGDLFLNDSAIELSIGEGRLELTNLQGDFPVSGRFEANGDMLLSEVSLDVEGRIKADGLPLGRYLTDKDGRALFGGQAGVDLRFRTSGRSLLSMVSSLAGDGTLSVENAALPRLDAKKLLARVGRAGNTAAVEAMITGANDGTTPMGIEKIEFTAENGRITVAPAKVEAGDLTGQIKGFVDLVGGRVDIETSLAAGATPRISIVQAGGFDAMSRQIELTGLITGNVRWREPSSGANSPQGSTHEPAGSAGLNEPAPQGVPSADPNGPPVGVIDEKVFELPLAGGG